MTPRPTAHGPPRPTAGQAGYALFMLGNAMAWIPYYTIVADIVPPAQRGVAAGATNPPREALGRQEILTWSAHWTCVLYAWMLYTNGPPG